MNKDTIGIVIALLIAIIALAFHVTFLQSGKIEAGEPSYSGEDYTCLTNSDCNSDSGYLCIVLDKQEPFCGCMEDIDCREGECINLVCQKREE